MQTNIILKTENNKVSWIQMSKVFHGPPRKYKHTKKKKVNNENKDENFSFCPLQRK